MPSFGELLRQRRLAAGLTQEALAERAGVSAKAISDLERNPDRTPRLDTVGLLAGALGPGERTALLAAARPHADGTRTPGERPVVGVPGIPRPLTPLIGRAGVAEAVTRLLRLAEGDPERARAELAEAAALFAATGNLVYLPWCLEALAGAAAAGHELSWAAELAGARDALRAHTGALLPPVHRAAYEQMLDVVRSGLGEADFAAAHGKLAHLAPPDIIEVIMEGEARHE
jgi:transcriptional regulator with XRE-family HTH domain